jgi:hypothetical protein
VAGNGWPPAPAIAFEDDMTRYVDNPIEFSADCAREGGRCAIGRDNFLFLGDGHEIAAVDWLQNKCGHVVVIPDPASGRRACLYHTSCPRMTDVVEQMFSGCLSAPASVPQRSSEMTVGEAHRRGVAMSYADCVARVDRFPFGDEA